MEWFREHKVLTWSLSIASAVMFAATLLIVPIVIVRIPADYFSAERRRPNPWIRKHTAMGLALRILRNAAGWMLVLVGVAMLVLPGQGVLTILLGLLLVEFPGKLRLERWLVSRKQVLGVINWQRKRRGVEEMRV